MDHVEFDREPPTSLTTLVMAFGGWIDAGRAATVTVNRFLFARSTLAPLRKPAP